MVIIIFLKECTSNLMEVINVKHKLTNMSQWMKQNEIEVSFITSTENVFYLSGFYSDPHERLLCLVLFQEAEPFIICPSMEKEDAKRTQAGILKSLDIVIYDNPWELSPKTIQKRISKVT